MGGHPIEKHQKERWVVVFQVGLGLRGCPKSKRHSQKADRGYGRNAVTDQPSSRRGYPRDLSSQFKEPARVPSRSVSGPGPPPARHPPGPPDPTHPTLGSVRLPLSHRTSQNDKSGPPQGTLAICHFFANASSRAPRDLWPRSVHSVLTVPFGESRHR